MVSARTEGLRDRVAKKNLIEYVGIQEVAEPIQHFLTWFKLKWTTEIFL